MAKLLLALLAAPPNLVLWITVDQLRGDMPWRFRDRFEEGGFRYLMDQGSSYTNAHFLHATTLTAVGHATLATGGDVTHHGMAGNDWFDSTRQRQVNCVEDEHDSLSPRKLTSSTFGDELVLASAGKSRVFSTSGKDRAAIIMAGHLGKAYWFSNRSGKFVSSRFYHPETPEWLTRWNTDNNADHYQGSRWDLLGPPESYLFSDQDDRWYEKSIENLGRTFPHTLQNGNREVFYQILKHTPMADELLLKFTRQLFREYRPGLSGHTDMLAISFSATDYVGHAFGPNSLEAEDNLLRLDRQLADLFTFIDEQVGLDKTLIVLSSDHGVSPIPEYMTELGFTAGRFQPERFMAQLDVALKAHYQTGEELLLAFSKPGIYLNTGKIRSLGLDISEVEAFVARHIVQVDGFTQAFTRSNLMAGSIPDSSIARSVAAAFHPDRSGNVIVVQDAYWYLSSTPNGDSAMHGSPHNYDTHVPILFAGPGIEHRVINRRVAPRDIAPTLSARLGISPPSGSLGVPLQELVDSR